MLESRKKVAMLGGSFDPVHLGHLFLLHCAISMSSYDTFLVVPATVSNFKQNNAPRATNEDRLEMLRLSLLDYKDLYPLDNKADIRLSTIELDRGGVSYTYDTVIDIKKSLNLAGRLGLIMGDDQIEHLNKWYRYADLKDEVEFIICRRDVEKRHWSQMPQDAQYIKIEPKELALESSSAFRAARSANMGYLSKRVAQYVTEHNLYH